MHLIEYDKEDFYEKELHVTILGYLREEKHFPSIGMKLCMKTRLTDSVVGDLQEAMRRDCLVAKDRLANDPCSSSHQQELLQYVRLKQAQNSDS